DRGHCTASHPHLTPCRCYLSPLQRHRSGVGRRNGMRPRDLIHSPHLKPPVHITSRLSASGKEGLCLCKSSLWSLFQCPACMEGESNQCTTAEVMTPCMALSLY
ncbi:mCG64353, partial [Mus musculus]